jgi:DNA polymerase III sliding clamp (beta) subunit (PCNA family)
MKATIPGKYVKLFAKALGCIQRIGNEALFEIVDDGLNIQSLNQARSAFVIFRFSKRFFGQFRRTTEAYPKFQVPIKVCSLILHGK